MDAQRALVAVSCSAFLIAGQVAGRAARDSLFLSEFSVSVLPVAMMASGALSILAAFGLSKGLSRSTPARLVPLAFGANALLFLMGAVVVGSAPRVVAVVLYLQMTAMLPVLMSGFWSVVNESFDPFAAKRVVPRMAAAGALAGVVGGIAAERLGSLFGVGWVLPLLALLAAACGWGLRRVGSNSVDVAPAREAVEAAAPLRLLRENPLLRQMALLIALAAVVESFVEYAMMFEASAAFRSPEELVRFFAAFYVGCGLLSFAFQASLGSALLRRFGLAGAIAVLPAAVAVTGTLAVAVGRLWAFVLVRAAENVAWNSAFRSGFELLYTPVPPQVKRRTKAWVDVGVRAAGLMSGGGVILLLLFLVPDLPTTAVVGLAVAAALAALVGVGRIHHSYVAQLSDSLREGSVQLHIEDVEDATTVHTIATTQRGFDRRALLEQIHAHHREREAGIAPEPAEPDIRRPSDEVVAPAAAPPPAEDPVLERVVDLCSGDPPRVRHALHARARESSMSGGVRAADHDRRLVAHAIPLLANPEVATDVQDFLRRLAPRCVGQLVDGLLDRAEPPRVRLALARLLPAAPDRRARDGLWRALDDPNIEIRLACAQAAVRLVERQAGLAVPKEVVHARIQAELESDATSWSGAGSSLDFVAALLALLHGRRTMTSTLEGLASSDPGLRGTALEFFESVLSPTASATLFERLGISLPGA